MSNTNYINDLKQKHDDTIARIQTLQDLEKYMFANLQKATGGGDGDPTQQQAIVDRINELKNVRTGLLNQLTSMYSDKQGELNSERNDLSDRLAQVGIIESELDRARKNISVLENNRNNKLRMTKLYEYQRKRYAAYTDVMKYIVIGCLIILALALLIKYNPIKFIARSVYTALMLITISAVVIFVGLKISDISSRNKFNFDQYDFAFDPAMAKPGYETVWEHDKKFFKKIDSDIDTYIDDAESEYNKASDAVSKYSKEFKDWMSSDYNTSGKATGAGAAAGAGDSSGVSNNPTTVTKVPGGSSIVLPSTSSKETFATFN